MANRRPIRRVPFARFGFRRRTPTRRWTAQLADAQNISTTALGTILLSDVGDYAQNNNLEPQGPTLVRTVGNISLVTTVATAYTAWFSIATYDVDVAIGLAASGDPAVVQNAIDDQLMWWHSVRIPAATVATHPFGVVQIPFDLRVKRKLLESRVVLNFVATNGAAGVQGNVTVNARLLFVGNSAT